MAVAVVGAGPVGAATALALQKRGYKVDVFEARSDPRKTDREFRSINLALSARGLRTLESIDPDMAKRVESFFVPMHGRMVHDVEKHQSSVNYGLYGESIQSISRLTLNELLLNELDKCSINVHFNAKVEKLSKDDITVNGEKKPFEFVVGCDGTYSKVRQNVFKFGEFDFSQEYIDHWYLEVPIPASNGTFCWPPNFLHVWPRGQHMFIALPNKDGSFTGTLFAPRAFFKSWDTPAKFVDLFRTQFPDVYDLVGAAGIEESYRHPRGKLVSIKTFPYNYEDKVIILGDAAHSVVPFYGQGLNCGLEDVRVLMELLDKSPTRLEAFNSYSKTRKADLDAIRQLSMDNYIEMRDSVTKPLFHIRKQIDGFLGRTFGDSWLPLYTMISFRSDIPYSQAIRENDRQNKVLEGSFTVALASIVGLATIAVYKLRK